MGAGGELKAEVAQGVFDRPEDLLLGQIDQFIGQAFENGFRLATESLEELLATCFTVLGERRSSRSGFVQHKNLPGVKASVCGRTGAIPRDEPSIANLP